MLEHALLRERFEQILAAERQAEDGYARLLGEVSDDGLRRQVEQLCRNKQRHVRLAERLLELVE